MKVPPTRLDNTEGDVLWTVWTNQYEHQLKMRGLKDLHLTQNRDVHLHLLAWEKRMKLAIGRCSVPRRRVEYYHQKKGLLFANHDDIMCVNTFHSNMQLTCDRVGSSCFNSTNSSSCTVRTMSQHTRVG